MKTKIYVTTIILLILNLFSVNAANYGGNLKIKVDQRPLNLNPIYAANNTAQMINKQIFDTLVKYNNQGKLSPNLAESWNIKSESTIFEFQLKEEAYFHPYKIEGKEVGVKERNVRAKDWKWSFEYLAAPKNKSPYAGLLDKIKGYDEYRLGKSDEITGIRIKDKYQLEIELKESYTPFIYNLAKTPAVVMPAKAVLNTDFNFSLSPVGTGAFSYADISANKVKLLKNNNYWQNNYRENELPYLEQIEINFTDKNNLEEDLGDFDLYQLNSKEFSAYQEQVAKNSEYRVLKMLNNNIHYAAVNYNSYSEQNNNEEEIKTNLRHILTKEELVKFSKLNDLILPTNKKEELLSYKLNNNIQQNISDDFNNELLNLKLATNNSEINIKLADFIRTKLSENNIDLSIEEYSWIDYLKLLNQKSLEAQIFIISSTYNNQFEFIYDNFYSESQKNYLGYQNERLDNLIDYLKLESNEQSRDRAFELITQIISTDNPFLFIFEGADSYLISERIKNQDLLKDIHSKYNFELLYFK